MPYEAVADPETGAEAALNTASVADGILVASGEDFVDLSWQSDSQGAQYAVYRDDLLLGTTTDTTIRDDSVPSGSAHNYRIERVWSGSESDEPTGDVVQSFGTLATTTLGDVSADVAVQEMAAAAAARTAAWVTVRTFIAQSRVGAPPATCEYGTAYEFGGDNRGYSTAASAAHRTSQTANLRFNNNNARLIGSSKSVGLTTVYRKSTGALVDSRRAGAGGIETYELPDSSNTKVNVRFSTTAQDPFCSVGKISGAFTMGVFSNGNWEIRSGSHRAAPHWEVYAAWVGGATQTIYRASMTHIGCLIGGACAQKQMGGLIGTL